MLVTAIGTDDRAVGQTNKGSAFTELMFYWRWSPSSLWRPLIQSYPRSVAMLDIDLQLPPICPALGHCREPERLCNLPLCHQSTALSQTAKICCFLSNNGSGVRTPRMQVWCCCSFAFWSLTSSITALSLCFLIYQMDRRTATTSQRHCEDEMTTHSVLERCLAHGKYSRQDKGTILVIITIDIILITRLRV